VVAGGIRSWLHPDEATLSIYALTGAHSLRSAFALTSFLAYIVYLCPIQEYVARAGVQAPIMNAFGARLAWVGAVVSTFVAATVFGAMHIGFGVLAVFLTALVGLYWGIVFVRTRSVLAVSVSHMVLGVAAFYWFGLIR
jgi:membrane protease YdiL (CAAX protease family)